MLKLLKKEFTLSMHPTTPLMLLLSAMVLIPNYPYVVMFFYTTMAIFFTCLLGRENHDVLYSINLPISKSDVVKARFMFVVIVELVQLTLMVPFTLLSRKLNIPGNQAGMDANIALFAIGFTVYALFNLVFFLTYYKNVYKVGAAFAKTSVIIFICAALDAATSYTVPFVKNCLDTADPQFLSAKLVFLAVGVLVYIVCTSVAYKISVKNFEKQDLN